MPSRDLRADARAIWQAGVDDVKPDRLIAGALAPGQSVRAAMDNARRILVVGGGKAGSAMAAAVERQLADRLDRVSGIVNVPAGTGRDLRAIRLHAARPAGSNEPTDAGVAGATAMLQAIAGTDAGDVVLCLISGGGSALLPLPAEGITLADKLAVTKLLSRCGATIGEMNCVRKHLSRIKGGQLAAAARCPVYSLIISDVIGDPLDVIASGPTAPDSTTFSDALAVLRKFDLLGDVPAAVLARLEAGAAGRKGETPRELPDSIHNLVIGSNGLAVAAARCSAEELEYRVVDLGPAVQGETADVARAAAERLRSIPKPGCLLIGGETTVTLPADHGLGGRNAEFVLAALLALRDCDSMPFAVLSGGTDGEDGPTDAAGAIGDTSTLERAAAQGLDAADFLGRHDSYRFFDATGDLLRTGLTQTNVMDLRVLLAGNG